MQRDSRKFGDGQTIENIKCRFFWTNLSRDVKKFVKNCFDCQKVKLPKKILQTKIDAFGSYKNPKASTCTIKSFDDTSA